MLKKLENENDTMDMATKSQKQKNENYLMFGTIIRRVRSLGRFPVALAVHRLAGHLEHRLALGVRVEHAAAGDALPPLLGRGRRLAQAPHLQVAVLELLRVRHLGVAAVRRARLARVAVAVLVVEPETVVAVHAAHRLKFCFCCVQKLVEFANLTD